MRGFRREERFRLKGRKSLPLASAYRAGLAVVAAHGSTGPDELVQGSDPRLRGGGIGYRFYPGGLGEGEPDWGVYHNLTLVKQGGLEPDEFYHLSASDYSDLITNLPLTAGSVVVVDTGGELQEDAGLTWDAAADQLMAQHSGAETATVKYPILVKHLTSGSMSNDFGVGILFQVEDDDATVRTLASIEAKRVDGVDTSSDVSFYTLNANAAVEALRLQDVGRVLASCIYGDADGIAELGSLVAAVEGKGDRTHPLGDLYGILGSSGDSIGVYGLSDIGRGVYARQDGTLAGDSAVAVLEVLRAQTLSGHAQTGPVVLADDTSGSGADLLDLRVGGVQKFVVDAAGAISVWGGGAHAATHYLGDGDPVDHAQLPNLDYASAAHTGFVPSARTMSATAPLAGGGDLSANRTLTVGGLSSFGGAWQLVGVVGPEGGWEYKTLAGTANQITVSNVPGTITLATPQDIHSAASPTFAALAASGALTGGSLITGGNIGLAADLDLMQLAANALTVNGNLSILRTTLASLNIQGAGAASLQSVVRLVDIDTSTRGSGIILDSIEGGSLQHWFAGKPYQHEGFQIGYAAVAYPGGAGGAERQAQGLLKIETNGNVGIAGNCDVVGHYEVDGTQVVTNRQPYIPNPPTGPPSAAGNRATIVLMLDLIEVHGLMAPVA